MVGTPRQQRLLRQIETGALDSKMPLVDVLRKVVMLGGRVGSPELRDWATRELTGYSVDNEVPDYRKVSLELLYDFTGGFGRGGSRIPMPPENVPAAAREILTSPAQIRFSLARLEELAAACSRGNGWQSLSTDLHQQVAHVLNLEQRRRDGRYADQFVSIYWRFDESSIRGIVDAVRTKLVAMVAEMVAEMPDNASDISSAVASQAYNVVMHGRSSLKITSAIAADQSEVSLRSDEASEATLDWKHALKIAGLAISGVLTVAALFFGIMQAQGWKIGEPSPTPTLRQPTSESRITTP